MQICLVRHGETEHGAADLLLTGADPGLSKNGKAQIAELCQDLGKDFDALFASPLKRAVESAEIIGQHLGKKFQVEPTFKESDPEALRNFFEKLKQQGHSKVLAVTHFVVIDPFYGLFPTVARKEIKQGTAHIFEI